MLDKTEVRQIAMKYVAAVKKELSPRSVLLFGSYVNGNPHEYSDIDIAVVFNGYKGNWFETAVLLQRLTRGISVDIEPHMMDEASDYT
ncbi:MAG: nucleotidyltransferase domain-containing protein [Methanomicrobiales archaeon]|jgi:predicted nucleotidyltransferase|nr:nucleotidyltransferase domain-containing protein [Methanomicrobiales archaeon]